jgi:hypothetical protein
MENNLGEIWSLFHFLMPGFLGSQKRFSELFRPALWLARKYIATFPHRSLNRRHKLLVAMAASALASLFLGSYADIRSLPAAWLFAYLSAASFLSGFFTPSAELAQGNVNQLGGS